MNAGPGPEAEPFNIPPVCKRGAHLSKGSRFQGVSYCSKGCSRGIQRDMGWRYLRISETALPKGKQDIVGTWVKRKTILITRVTTLSAVVMSQALYKHLHSPGRHYTEKERSPRSRKLELALPRVKEVGLEPRSICLQSPCTQQP